MNEGFWAVSKMIRTSYGVQVGQVEAGASRPEMKVRPDVSGAARRAPGTATSPSDQEWRRRAAPPAREPAASSWCRIACRFQGGAGAVERVA
jgi:hypothetical protein